MSTAVLDAQDLSLEQRVALLPLELREQILADLDLDTLPWDWSWTARPSQRLPLEPVGQGADWRVALFNAGRGAGKTRSGGEFVRELDQRWYTLGRDPGQDLRIALLGRTAGDVRDTILNGPSGLLNIYPPSLQDKVEWISSQRRVNLPNGGFCLCFSAEEPDQLRGPAFHCFPAGTLVRTARGPIPIEQVQTGEQVWTRQGLRPVEAASISISEVVTVRHERGALIGTPEHPVLTQRGWVPMALVNPSDRLVGWVSGSGRSTIGDVSIGDVSTEVLSGVPTPYGRTATVVRSLSGTRSTTSTSIDSTMSRATYWRSPMMIMSRFIGRLSSRGTVSSADRSSTSTLSAATGSSATDAGSSDVRRRTGERIFGALSAWWTALTAGRSSRPETAGIAVSGVSTSGLATRVYNLTVADVPEFFADDILVHNCGWGDELAAYKQIKGQGNLDAWTNLRIATRLGLVPQVIATTTPKRVKVLRELIAEILANPDVMLLRQGKTTDNIHLAAAYLATLEALYGGTTLGAQELDGLMLDNVLGATADSQTIEDYRVTALPMLGPGVRWARIIAVDPSVAEKPGDECGIVVIYAPLTQPILHRHAFVVDDLSLRASPTVWGDRVVKAAVKHHAVVVVENNQGGALVKRVIKERAAAHDVPPPKIREVWSSKAKQMRAEPIGAAYQRGRVHHLNVLADLEDQVSSWTPADEGYSPDRLDALVHGLAAILFPQATVKGGTPGSAVSHPNAGTSLPRTRATTERRTGGFRIDTGGRNMARPSGLQGIGGRQPGLLVPHRVIGGRK